MTERTPDDETRESYRATFAGVVQGSCEECGNCDDECPCDNIVDRLVDSALSIRAEDHDTLLAEVRRMREALEQIVAADHATEADRRVNPYSDGVHYAGEIARAALSGISTAPEHYPEDRP